MKASSKVILGGFLIVLCLFAIGGFISKGRTSETKQAKQQVDISSGSAEQIFTEEPQDTEATKVDYDNQASYENNMFLQVTDQDCKNECKGFQLDEDVTYCKQVCGLTAPKKDVSGCESLSDLEKDYCYKDLAIFKNDPRLCEKVEDAGVEKTCKNRLLEDIAD